MQDSVETARGAVSVATTEPGHGIHPANVVVVLAHGAGTDMHHASLRQMSDGLASAGYDVVRFNFPYREAGRRAPDRMPVLTAAYGAVLDAVARDARLGEMRVVIGGRSMGGRAASHLAAEGRAVDGLLYLAFPLHPAGRPGTERARHLPAIDAPMLFVQGTRDALADWNLLQRTLSSLERVTLHAIVDGDHGFRVPKRRGTPARVSADVLGACVAWLATLGAADR